MERVSFMKPTGGHIVSSTSFSPGGRNRFSLVLIYPCGVCVLNPKRPPHFNINADTNYCIYTAVYHPESISSRQSTKMCEEM